jgi:hypothetical protein
MMILGSADTSFGPDGFLSGAICAAHAAPFRSAGLVKAPRHRQEFYGRICAASKRGRRGLAMNAGITIAIAPMPLRC